MHTGALIEQILLYVCSQGHKIMEGPIVFERKDTMKWKLNKKNNQFNEIGPS